jgi:hypothetical protein
MVVVHARPWLLIHHCADPHSEDSSVGTIGDGSQGGRPIYLAVLYLWRFILMDMAALSIGRASLHLNTCGGASYKPL